jgi:hypothetical protein
MPTSVCKGRFELKKIPNYSISSVNCCLCGFGAKEEQRSAIFARTTLLSKEQKIREKFKDRFLGSIVAF